MSDSVNLHSMPFNFDAWAKIAAGLTPAQEGTLLRAVRVAWGAGHRGAPVATLPADTAELARMLGGREHLDVVRRHFRPVEGSPELLAWPWLTKEHTEAMRRYTARKLAGVESGETRRRRAKERKEGKGTPAPKAPTTAPEREQCSNNVPAMLEQPEPYPRRGMVPNGTIPLTGGADAAPAVAGRAAPPLTADEITTAVMSEDLLAWAWAHPETVAALKAEADADMSQLQPEWRALPRSFGIDVRNAWLERRLVAAYRADLESAAVHP